MRPRRPGAHDARMDRVTAIARLPGDYGFALLLRDAGASEGEIAARFGTDRNGVRHLLVLAEAKLDALLASTEPEG
jgi:DNA-directed RNA polymerase specialized sigma24 family protein